MNKNRGFTPLAVVLMLSGSLALTGCDDKQAQQGGQQMPAVGVVTVKTEPLQITTELPGRTSAYRIAEVRPQVSGIILAAACAFARSPFALHTTVRKVIWRKPRLQPISRN